MDVRIIRVGERSCLKVGESEIEVSDYTMKTSANGELELSVTFKGIPTSSWLQVSLNDTPPMFKEPEASDCEVAGGEVGWAEQKSNTKHQATALQIE